MENVFLHADVPTEAREELKEKHCSVTITMQDDTGRPSTLGCGGPNIVDE